MRTMKRALALTCAALLVTSTAWAQDEAEQDEAEAIQGPLKDQLEEYWSVQRDLVVIKGRLYEREGRLHLGFLGGIMPSEQFYVYYPLGGRASYLLNNELGFELGGHYLLATSTEITDFLVDTRSDDFDPTTDAEDLFLGRVSLVAQWHPLYGKLALLQRKLSHFDVNFLAGLAVTFLDRPSEDRLGNSTTVAPNVVLGMGLNLFMTESFTVSVEGRGYIHVGPSFRTDAFAETNFLDQLKFPAEVMLGLTYAL